MIDFHYEEESSVAMTATVNDGQGYVAVFKDGNVLISGQMRLIDLAAITGRFLSEVPLPAGQRVLRLAPI